MTHLSARRTAGSPSRRSGCFSNAPQSFGIMRHAYTAGPGEVVRDIAPGGRNTGGVPANSAWHTAQSGYEAAAARPRNAMRRAPCPACRSSDDPEPVNRSRAGCPAVRSRPYTGNPSGRAARTAKPYTHHDPLRKRPGAGVFSFSRAILVLSLQKPKPECFT